MAIKVLHVTADTPRELIARFHEEAHISATVHHRNVIDVHDTGTLDDGSPYLVMERVEGETLHARMRHGTLTIREVLELGTELLNVLCVLSELGIVHRDIKPENLMLQTAHHGGRVVKLVDFGISKVVHSELSASTSSGRELVGTPHYMSPEHLSGEEVDARSDIYAAGVVLYEALTGRLPHDSSSLPGLIFSVVTGRPRAIRSLRFDCPAELERIVLRALEPDRQRRYATPLEMLADLEAEACQIDQSSRSLRAAVDAAIARSATRTRESGPTEVWDAPTCVAPSQPQPPPPVSAVSTTQVDAPWLSSAAPLPVGRSEEHSEEREKVGGQVVSKRAAFRC
jgi:serine/threonine-protein kinase